METPRRAVLVAMAAYVMALIGAGLFLGYVIATGAGVRVKGPAREGVEPWLVNVGLVLLFAGQHSVMARRTFKTWIARIIPAYLERCVYVGASGIVLGLLTLLWQPLPGEAIWHGPIWISLISVIAAALTGCCVAWFNHGEFFGFRQAATGEAEIHGPLRIDGPYRYVRHPLMLGFLVTLWAHAVMPPELLMLNLGLTLYVLIAIRLEERDLEREFGEAYARYRREVPMLMPFLQI